MLILPQSKNSVGWLGKRPKAQLPNCQQLQHNQLRQKEQQHTRQHYQSDSTKVIVADCKEPATQSKEKKIKCVDKGE